MLMSLPRSRLAVTGIARVPRMSRHKENVPHSLGHLPSFLFKLSRTNAFLYYYYLNGAVGSGGGNGRADRMTGYLTQAVDFQRVPECCGSHAVQYSRGSASTVSFLLYQYSLLSLYRVGISALTLVLTVDALCCCRTQSKSKGNAGCVE